MAYVDLNPVRAGIASTPEDSDYTSFQMRCTCFKRATHQPLVGGESALEDQPDNLHAFVGSKVNRGVEGIEFNLSDYLELVDWTGRQIRENKAGSIDKSLASILRRMSVTPEHWVYLCRNFESKFKGIVGTVESLKTACRRLGRMRVPNRANSAMYFA